MNTEHTNGSADGRTNGSADGRTNGSADKDTDGSTLIAAEFSRLRERMASMERIASRAHHCRMLELTALRDTAAREEKLRCAMRRLAFEALEAECESRGHAERERELERALRCIARGLLDEAERPVAPIIDAEAWARAEAGDPPLSDVPFARWRTGVARAAGR